MKRASALFLLLLAGSSGFAEDYTVTRLAGPGTGPGYVDATGAAARFSGPSDVAADASGNVYVADWTSAVIRKITPFGVVSTLAGRAGERGFVNGRGGAARFFGSRGIAVDLSGNVFVADQANHAIRKISPSGVVSTFGTGITDPVDVATDSVGNVYACSAGGIRKYTPAGVITAMYSTSEFLNARNLTFDANDTLFFTTSSHVRKMTAGGVVSTIAAVQGAEGVAVTDTGDLYVGGSSRIVRITPDGTVTAFAGQENMGGSADGMGAQARFSSPFGLAIAPGGLLYVADFYNSTIRKVTIPGAVVTTVAGTTAENPGSIDGPADDAKFFLPYAATVDSAGNVVVADHFAIRKISPGGVVSTAASSNTLVPTGIDAAEDDTLYVANHDFQTIGKVTPDGTVTILAGLTFTPGSTDGTGSGAQFRDPADVVVHPGGDLYVTDSGNHTIRKVTTAGVVTTFAGLAGQSGSGDGTGAAARFNNPGGITVDDGGNLYVVDKNNYTIRMITVPGAVVTTFAGSAGQAGLDDGTGTSARLWFPNALTFDGGNLYVRS